MIFNVWTLLGAVLGGFVGWLIATQIILPLL
jgi:hypothetical protein